MSGLSRNKLTSTSGPKRSTASSVLSGGRPSKLRSELRRVMSDRVMKITQCSKQQNVIKKDTLLNSSGLGHSMSQNRMALAAAACQKEAVKKADGLAAANQTLPIVIKSPQMPDRTETTTAQLISQETSPKFQEKLTGTCNVTTYISPNAKLSNKITLEPIKTFGKPFL